MPPEETEARAGREFPEVNPWLADFRHMGPLTRLGLLIAIIDFVLNHSADAVAAAGAVEHVVQQVLRTAW